MAVMPNLTRRLADPSTKTWHVYCDDVNVGSISRRSGVPGHVDSWAWQCGFYPGCHPRDFRGSTSQTFEQARVNFNDAWQKFLPTKTEADFQKWRDWQNKAKDKYERWSRGEYITAEQKRLRHFMTCPACGVEFDTDNPADVVGHHHRWQAPKESRRHPSTL